MTLFLAVFIPIAILGFLYLIITKNNSLPDWMERASAQGMTTHQYELFLRDIGIRFK